MPPNHDSEVENRLWSALTKISDRLTGIDSKLSDIVRLEERMNGHDGAISRYGDRIDSHDNRLRDLELFQAKQGDVIGIKEKVDNLETAKDRYTGQRDITKEVLKWAVGILTAILIYKLTRG